MNENTLDRWAELLLDTGKRNNLVNFHDSKSLTAEILCPDLSAVFSRVAAGGDLEVYDPDFADGDEDGEDAEEEYGVEKPAKKRRGKRSSWQSYSTNEDGEPAPPTREEYLAEHGGKLKRGQVLCYNPSVRPSAALRNIGRRGSGAIEETGVNVVYMAFGFLVWKEKEKSDAEFRAPLLLAPVVIKNASAAEPVTLDVAEGELLLNPTFQYKAQVEFGVTLPDYDDEEIGEYLAKVEEIADRLDWRVETGCKIGIFSFLKLNMYRDLLDNRAAVLASANVRALLGDPFADSALSGAPRGEQEEELPLRVVVDADSSQEDAIRAARAGGSFVLQGPPGTGKSQTITNIIAELLGEGKTVLFVSEKLAALGVVSEKLKAAGLGDFCLELHSYKSNKREVISELCRTLRAEKRGVAARAETELSALTEDERRLDDYARELHEKDESLGMSLFELYEAHAADRGAPEVDAPVPDPLTSGEKHLGASLAALREHAEYAPEFGGDFREYPWYGCLASSPLSGGIKRNLATADRAFAALKSAAEDAAKAIGEEAKSVAECLALAEFLQVFANGKLPNPKLFVPGALATAEEEFARLRGASEEIAAIRETLCKKYRSGIENEDAEADRRILEKSKSALARLFGGDYRRLRARLASLRKDGGKPTFREIGETVGTLEKKKKLADEFRSVLGKTDGKFGAAFCDVDSFRSGADGELRRILLAKKEFSLDRVSGMTDGEFAAAREASRAPAAAFLSAFRTYGETLGRLSALFDKGEYDFDRADLDRNAEKMRGCLERADEYPHWEQFALLLRRMTDLGIREFVCAALDAGIPPRDFPAAYRRRYYAAAIDRLLESRPAVRTLTRIPHDDLVREFRDKDRLRFEINRAILRRDLSARRPSLDVAAKEGEISILLREGEKKRRQMPVRNLFRSMCGLVQTLKPCILMSPISVSTYLSPDTRFDAVVFDEASQIFPQDALGAIYRGKQLIVVGDSKQMPPTDFFRAEVLDEDAEEDAGDFESVLDLARASFPERRLKWHYRSRSEALIAFSNENFYGGELVTFPSHRAPTPEFGVGYLYAGGTFDRKSRTNRKEAEVIVDLVYEHARTRPNESLGVVVFGMAQQDLVERLLAARRRAEPLYEEFFKADKPEPFFVKNLETVQGDERDAIVLGVAYGRDEEGRLLLNFGPINRAGGERRLNVAVTRAKTSVTVVSSMHATDIDLTRAQSNGAKLLRDYLDYAEHGTIALRRAPRPAEDDAFDSDFEEDVCEFLRANGYSVDTQVGCSSFRIDLAVKRHDSSDYFLAVECDGASYHSSRSARDRDRLRQDILEGMGWKFYRVWSTDWFKNRRFEEIRLLAAVRRAEEGDAAETKADEGTDGDEEKDGSGAFEVAAAETSGIRDAFPEYAEVSVKKAMNAARGDYPAMAREVLLTESPLSEEWLIRRIAESLGRRPSAIALHYRDAMRGAAKYGIKRRGGFLYLDGKSVDALRLPSAKGEGKREIDDIAPEELAAGLLALVRMNFSVGKEGLYRKLLDLLGLPRLTASIRARLDAALALLSDRLEEKNGILTAK